MESHQRVEDEAASWLVRRDAGDWSESDQAALSEWLEGSTARMVAYVRLEAAWKRLRRLQSLGAGTPAGVVPSPDDWQLSAVFERHVNADGAADEADQKTSLAKVTPFARRVERASAAFDQRIRPARRHWYGFAAALVLCACLGLAARIWLFSASTYSTPVGGIASVPMEDGSKVTLNTNSKIRVDVSSTQRGVQLDYGEAFFQVAHDPSRPFVVTAGDRRVIAIGTAFSVRRVADDTVWITVTEGKVRIEQQHSLTREGQNADVMLPAGNIALTQKDQVMLQQKPMAQVEEAVSWRTGFLVFHQTALTEVVAELNRYNTRKIVVGDPSLATIRLSGRFEPTQYAAFIRLLEEGFPIRAVNEGERVVLTAR